MFSQKTQEIAKLYTERHETRWDVFGDKPYANYGYWSREGMSIDEACDAMTDLVAQASGMTAGDRVLEVGCGYGASAVYYARRYRPASVNGIDITDVRLENARDYVERNGLSDTIHIGLGDATALDFPPDSFNRVLGVECAFHFDTRREFLKEAVRVLAAGGGLALADLILREGEDPQSILSASRIDNYGKTIVKENVHDRRVYEGQLRDAGFVDVSVRPITDKTLLPLIDHLERVARQQKGEKAAFRARTAEVYRHYHRLGMEYVLVSARKPDA